jgi:hypothetical protein
MADPMVTELFNTFFSSIFKVLTMGILLIMLLSILVLFIKRGRNKLIGGMGEKFVSRKLYSPNSAQYKSLNNLVLPSRGNTKVTQIDHVIVSNYGIFVVETKAHKGWIFGNANQEYWTQIIFKYKKRFYNPLRQNFAHIKAIEDLLGSKLKAPIISLIAFPYADKLKISGTDSVGYTCDTIKKIESYKSIIYSDAERDEIFNLLLNANIVDAEVNKQHRREVRGLKNAKKIEEKQKELKKLEEIIKS